MRLFWRSKVSYHSTANTFRQVKTPRKRKTAKEQRGYCVTRASDPEPLQIVKYKNEPKSKVNPYHRT